MVISLEEILEFVKGKASYLANAEALFDIYNRNLTPYLEKRLVEGLDSMSAVKEAKTRMAPINILPKIVDKLSNVYKANVTRTTQNTPLWEELDTKYKWNLVMREANKYLNLHRCVAIEPVYADRELSKFRVIPAHKFLVMDDGTIDGEIVAFIKIISDKQFQVYTKEEFFILSDDGKVTDLQVNEHGIIPVCYLTRDCLTVMPPEDRDTYEMVTLLPLLMTDLNYALKFQCFSIIYTIDVDIKNMTQAPNAVWPLTSSSSSGDQAKPSIGSIKPEVAVGDLLDALFTQYSLWLESRSLKMGSFDRGGASNLSGIAKAIDTADIEADLEYQREIFSEAEANLFNIVSVIGGLREAELAVTFAKETMFAETPTETVDRTIKELNAGLIDRRTAIKTVRPNASDEEVEAIMVSAKEVTDVRSGDERNSEASEAE